MTVVATTLLAGCYSPTITPGTPCDLAIGNCPRPLECTPGPTGATCEPAGTQRPDAPAPADAAIDAAPDAPMIDASPDAPAITHVEYASVVADCVDPADPDPDFCIARNGAGQMAVDADDTASGNGWESFVRFDLDATIAGRTVTSVKLQLSATSDGSASSGSTGAVWRVATFTRTSLAVTVPATIGSQPLAGSQGAVDPDDVVVWTLPTGLPAANSSVFLKIKTADTDGVLYHNQTSAKRPRLIIDLQ